MPPDLIKVVQTCLRRVRHWQAPPRWSSREWIEEATAQGYASACEAWNTFDFTKGGDVAAFVQGRVMAGILSLYRREWAYARRVMSEERILLGFNTESSPAEEAIHPLREVGERRSRPRNFSPSLVWDNYDLQSYLADLAFEDQELLRQVFWERRSESEIARVLGISQPALNKRKQRVLRELRTQIKKTL